MEYLRKTEVPEGVRGPWRVERYNVSAAAAQMANMAVMVSEPFPLERMILAGGYTRLVHKTRGVVMSDVPSEVATHFPAVDNAHGNCLVFGLGLGMVTEALIRKPEVNSVRVVELDQDVIDLVCPYLVARHPQANWSVELGDATSFAEKSRKYDTVWIDIWDEVSSGNLPEMTRLKRKHGRLLTNGGWIGCWSEDYVTRMNAYLNRCEQTFQRVANVYHAGAGA